MASYVKEIGIYKKYIIMRYIMYLVPRYLGHIVQFEGAS